MFMYTYTYGLPEKNCRLFRAVFGIVQYTPPERINVHVFYRIHGTCVAADDMVRSPAVPSVPSINAHARERGVGK